MLPPHGGVAHVADLPGEPGCLDRELAQRPVLDLVLAAHLLDEELGVGDHLDAVETEIAGALEPGDEGAVLGDVVRRDPDRLSVAASTVPSSASDHVAWTRPARGSRARRRR